MSLKAFPTGRRETCCFSSENLCCCTTSITSFPGGTSPKCFCWGTGIVHLSFRVCGLSRPHKSWCKLAEYRFEQGFAAFIKTTNVKLNQTARTTPSKHINMTSRRKKSREKGGCSTLTDWPGSCSDSLPHPKCTCYQDRVNHRPGESTITHTCTLSLSAFNTSLRTTKQGSMSAFFAVSGGKNCPQSIQARALSLWSLCISLTKHNSTIED